MSVIPAKLVLMEMGTGSGNAEYQTYKSRFLLEFTLAEAGIQKR